MKKDTIYLQVAAALTERGFYGVTPIRENEDAPIECVRVFADPAGRITRLEDFATVCAFFDCRWAVYEGNQQSGMFIEIMKD